MSETPIILIAIAAIVLIIVLVIVLVLRRQKQERERTEHLDAIARLLGWQFGQEAPMNWIPNMEKFALFNEGHSREIKNIMYGQTKSVKAALFDYVYVTGHGKHRSTHYQSVVYFEPPALNLPFFSLRPEHFLHKVIAAFGYQDIDFGNRPTFSSKYLLRGAEEQAIRNTFRDELLNYYEANEGVSTDGGGNQLFIFRSGYRTPPDEAQSFIESASQLRAVFTREHPGY